ncbi:glycosyltransferase family 9 protein [Maridesulfovibrio ferrireducens]|uniref:glycosyltransferase family 9 protein n=1 Tax=Maridesulfovibrio ferrireducens TaxID=246191 RepID=UPI001A2A48DC|nr:glycosyltransferase family 9 protein [Maridesulfovibrio ferrireducens]MBI9112129.1 glycosyltransferase family 9 protein [Maridesulfovibrio ferrireducens]
MKALVINLTRFGDLLQTQPVVSGLVQSGYDTSIMCLDNFSGTTELMRDVSLTFAMPGASVLAALDRDWRESLNIFESFCAEIETQINPDLIVNLTPSLPARLLAMRLSRAEGKGRELRGFAVDSFGFNADTTPWAGFLQVASTNRGASPFNVVDLFSRVAGLGNTAPFRLAEPSSEMKAAADKYLAGPIPGAEGFVGFQPGASEERRRWPVKYFRELGDRLWKELRKVPVLLGTKGEQHLGERILEGATFPAVNLMGKTGLPELAAVLGKLDVLITNDTGTMHLAAGAGTPVAAIFLATAQPWDTGPAAVNSLCLEPDADCHPCSFGVVCPNDHMCRHEVGADVVFNAVSRFIKNGVWEYSAEKGVRSYLTGRDELGFMTLSSLSGHDETDRHKWIILQRELYRRFLDEEDLSALSLNSTPPSREFCLRLMKPLSEARDLLFLLSKQSELLQGNPMESLKVKFLANFQKIQDILSSSPELTVLSSLWYFESRAHDSMDGLSLLLNRYRSLVSALHISFE